MPSTRRALLAAAAAAGVTATAGCNALSGSASRDGRARPYGDVVLDYEQVRSTVDGERSLYRWTGDSDLSDRYLLLATGDRAANVEFLTDETTTVQRTVEQTDYDEASALLFQGRHTACHHLDVFEIIRRPEKVKATVCRGVRPADVACSTDQQRTTALVVRLPFAVDADTGLSVGRSSRCSNRFGPRRDGEES